MRVVVTGGAGFLGAHFARHLVESGLTVGVLDRAAPPAWFAGAGIEFAHCDVRDARAVRQGVKGADAVVHAAFAPPRAGVATMQEVNVGGTGNVCTAALDQCVRRVVVVSSTIVERPPRSPGSLRRSALARLEAYRATRAAAERVAARLGDGPLEVATVRPKTFVGPERVGAFGIVFDLVRRGDAVPLPGDGGNRYQMLDIRDFAAGLRLLTVEGGRGLFYFGASRFGTLAEDLQAVIDHAGTGARLRPLPRRPVAAALRAMELAGLPPLSEWYQCGARGEDSVVDIGRAVRELGWRPERSNEESLLDAYEWYRDRRAAGQAAPTTHPVPRAHRVLSAAVRMVLR